MSRTFTVCAFLAALLGTSCDNATGPGDGPGVAVRFAAASPAQSAGLTVSAAADEVSLTGRNGTLTITDIHLVLREIELESADDVCEREIRRDRDDDDDDDDDEEDDDRECEGFEAGPRFVELPFTGAAAVLTQEVPAGTYTELELEVKDLDLDDDDDDRPESLQNLRRMIREAGFANWPEDASMVVVGTFTPTGGTARPFTVFFEARIKMEMELEPPLLVTESMRTITIDIDPTLWFRTFAGTVVDLSAFDFATTGKVPKLEAKFEDGFSRIRFDR